MQNKYAMYVLIFVKHVLKNVKNILIWIIVKSAHKHVEDVPKNVAKCDGQKRETVNSIIFLL